jgi:superfamily I DNA/RNA helicase
MGPDSRAIFVGDRHQSIYAFTGANAKSFDLIKSEYNCTELPLSVCFRCAKKIVEFAQAEVPHIQPHEDSPEGNLPFIDETEMLKMEMNSDDAILCRNNAPLVKLAYGFLARNIPCHIEGKDIGAKLIKLAKRWKRITMLLPLADKLNQYREHEMKKLVVAKKDRAAEEIDDLVTTLLVIIENLPKNAFRVDDLVQRLKSLFTDSDGNQVETLTLSSIHKAKGLEFPRVFWYGANLYQPSPYAKKPEDIEQEKNLIYVAKTRAMKELYVVNAIAKVTPKKKVGK